MKAINYLRVSTDIQDYTRQVSDIQIYCQNNQLDLVKTFEEKESGKKKNRIQVKAMLDYLKLNPDVKYIVISELSRLGRTAEVPVIIESLNDLKVCLISLKEGIKTLNQDFSINTTSALIISVIAGISTFELSTLNYRIRSGKKEKASKGGFNGGANVVYGYDVQNKQLVINEFEAQVVQRIFNLYTGGKSFAIICDILNSEGIKAKNGGLWLKSSLYNIVISTIYTGKREYKGEVYNLPELRIVSDELFEQANNLRTSNSNKMHKIIKKYDYLLAGNTRLITCGVCGKHYYGHNNINTKANNYECYSKKIKASCDNHSINVNKLDKAVLAIIEKYYTTEIAKKVDIQYFQNLINEATSRIEDIKNQQKKYESQFEKLNDLYIEGNLSKAKYNEKKQAIEAKKVLDELYTIKLESNIHNYQYQINLPEEFTELNQDKLKSIVQSIIIFPVTDYVKKSQFDKAVRVELTIRNTTTVFQLNHSTDELIMLQEPQLKLV